jgi:hypothetical protein
MPPRTPRSAAASNKEIADVVAAAVAAAAAKAAESVAAAAATAATATATAAAAAATTTATTAAATAAAAVEASNAAAAAIAANSKDAERQFMEIRDRTLAVEGRMGALEVVVGESNKNTAEILELVRAGKLGGKVATWLGGVALAIIAILSYFRGH